MAPLIARRNENKAEHLVEQGLDALDSGDPRRAAAHLSAALRLSPGDARLHFNLALALRACGETAAAEKCLRRAGGLDPQLHLAHHALADLLYDRGDLAGALAGYRRAVEIAPGFAEAHYNMGHAARAMGDLRLAAACYRRAIAARKDYAEAWNNLGLAYGDMGRPAAAVAAYRRALAADPGLPEALYNLGMAEHSQGRWSQGLRLFERAVRARPDYAPARWMWRLSLPVAYRSQRELEECRRRFCENLDALVRETRLDTPQQVAAAVEGIGSTTNFYLAYQGQNDRELQERYGRFAAAVMAAAYPRWSQRPPMPAPAPGGRIRVGYVSSFMCAHTVGELLAGWLAQHDRRAIQVYGYHIGGRRDAVTERIRGLCSEFRHPGADLEKAAAAVCGDRLHVLVFTDVGMNPLATQLAALHLAPVQCKGWGHPVTTGLPTIDYYLSSELMEPDDGQEHYTEKLVRLPNLALAYTPPPLPDPPKPREAFGLKKDDFVFLSPQSLFKYLPQHDDLYPRIACRAPAARFVFLAHDSGGVTRIFRERLEAAFAARGLCADDYCRFLPRQCLPDFLSLNLASDALLDTLEWSGGKTTLEAIACGLPVVTCPGGFMRGRHAFAMLKGMGVTETIARDKAAYVDIAARLCSDPGFRESVAARVRANRESLYGDASCIRALEAFYRRLVDRQWTAGKAGTASDAARPAA